MGAARHHALALVEAQHDLLVGQLAGLSLLRVTLHVAVPQPPLTFLPQDQRLDVPQLGHHRGRNPVQQLPAPGLARRPRHGALCAVGVVALRRRFRVALVRLEPIDVERNQPPAELAGDHPEPVIPRVRLVGLLTEVAAERFGAPFLDKGGFTSYRNKRPPIREHVFPQQFYGSTLELVRTICNSRVFH